MEFLKTLGSFIVVSILILMWIMYGSDSGAFDPSIWTTIPSSGALIFLALFCMVIAGGCVLDFGHQQGRNMALPAIVWGIVALGILHIAKVNAPHATAAEDWWILTGLPVIFFAGWQVYSWILILRRDGHGERIVPRREEGKLGRQGGRKHRRRRALP